MNHRYAVLAGSAFAMGATAFVATQASAEVKDPTSEVTVTAIRTTEPPWPDEGANYPGFEDKPPEYSYPEYKLGRSVAPSTNRSQTSVDGHGAEAVQAGASAVGGAGLALGGSWLYRRRRVPVA